MVSIWKELPEEKVEADTMTTSEKHLDRKGTEGYWCILLVHWE